MIISVLILILMEYALWHLPSLDWTWTRVLILILMEYALWQDGAKIVTATIKNVLILILMEYALWLNKDVVQKDLGWS